MDNLSDFSALPLGSASSPCSPDLSKCFIRDQSPIKRDPDLLLKRRISDGRPLWEPPVLDYSLLIDTKDGEQSYTKRREAALNYTKGDVVKTTQILDFDDEKTLLVDYGLWASDEIDVTEDAEQCSFYENLRRQLMFDIKDIDKEFPHSGLGSQYPHYWFFRNENGPWVLQSPTFVTEKMALMFPVGTEEEFVSDDSDQTWSEDEQSVKSIVDSLVASPVRTTPFHPTTTITPGLHLTLNTSQIQANNSLSSRLAHRLLSLRDNSDEVD